MNRSILFVRTLPGCLTLFIAGAALSTPLCLAQSPTVSRPAIDQRHEAPFPGTWGVDLAEMGPPPSALPDDGLSADRPVADWCVTQQRYIERLRDRGEGGGGERGLGCPESGPCDNPANRDASIPTLDTPIKTYRLSIHVFCENNGGNCAGTQANVDAVVAMLNEDFAPWRIQFVYETNFINKTQYRYLAAWEEFGMKDAYAVSPATQLNVFVVNTGGGNWGTFPWDPDALTNQGGIVMNDTSFGLVGWILTHEVGHCLGLWHTFHGTDEVPQCSECYEPAGRTPEQGDVTGDWCSDTNASPRHDGRCFDPTETDPCSGNPWVAIPYLNYMSYAYACTSEFTPQQAGRMHCWTEGVLSTWLELPAPPAAPGTPTLTRIGGGQVRVAWTDNSNNEDGFRVQRETKQGSSWINQTTIDVGAVTVWSDAPGRGTFRYRAQAYNEIGNSEWSAWRQVNN